MAMGLKAVCTACQRHQRVLIGNTLDSRLLLATGCHSMLNYAVQPAPIEALWHGLRALQPPLLSLRSFHTTSTQEGQGRRPMSTGGISRKDFLWGISGRPADKLALKPTDAGREAVQEEATVDIAKVAEQAGYASVQDAFERVILEAYRLLQSGKVDQAEYLIVEGMKNASIALSEEDPMLAALWDQAALLQFFQGRFPEAEVNARRSLAAARQLPEEDGKLPAVAMCQLRLGTVLLGLDRRGEAGPLLREGHEILDNAFGSEYEPVAEALFYRTLVDLPEMLSRTDLANAEDAMAQGLQGMRRSAGVGPHLVRAALREHSALLDGPLAAQHWDLTDALFEQAMRLQDGVAAHDELALSSYQYGTLQYARGLHEDARALCATSLELCRKLYKENNNQVSLRLHRQGTIALASGDVSEALESLTRSCAHFMTRVGEANPLTGESRAGLALSKLLSLERSRHDADPYTRVLNPGRRRELIAEAEEGLEHMERGFGAYHMLVVKMRKIQADLLRA